MNHKVANVTELHSSAQSLYNNVVVGSADTSADTIISNLVAGIENLKNNWKGKDAGVQIQNIVIVHNAMIGIRNALGELASSASKIAVSYRDIQNSNGAGLETLGAVSYETKSPIADYIDNTDTINITQDANAGKASVDAANNAMAGFINQVKTYSENIFNNWTEGAGREEAKGVFEQFVSSSQTYQEKLSEVSKSISDALQNYTF